jgi:hypothetical protein
MTLRILTLAASGLIAIGGALAAEEPGTPPGYVATGASKSCLRIMQIDSLKILNETQILVEMKGGETYLQQPRSCSKLRKHYAFKYDVVGSELCDTTAVTLIDPGAAGQFVGVCMFDEFQTLEKQNAAAN